MNEGIIQNQIRLVAFKAAKVTFSIHPRDSSKGQGDPKFDLKLSDILIEESPNMFAKVFFITTEIPFEHESLEIYIEFHTVFECSNKIDSAFLQSDFAKISAPAIGFPFVRSFVSTITLQGGYPPVILPSINFIQFSKEQESKPA